VWLSMLAQQRPSGVPALQVQGLSKRYGRTVAVADLHLTLPAGMVFGLLGPNGAGKTTTLRMLLGLVRPTAGRAFIFGLPCGSVGARAPGLVGALVEEPAFYPYLTGRQNLQLLCRLSGGGEEDINWALACVGLAGVADRLYQEYSHGMRQRLGLAAALVPRPRLLLLDEPASGLDPAGLQQIRHLLRSLAAEGMTILLSSHLLFEVQQLCTHVGLMFAGRLLAQGPVEELLGDPWQQLEVVVDHPDRARQVLQAAGYRVQAGQNGSLRVAVSRAQVPALNRHLVAAGLGVYALIPRSRTLEDLYMQYAEDAHALDGHAG
jgi:ABC-2 type transport system ATP-binding protein